MIRAHSLIPPRAPFIGPCTGMLAVMAVGWTIGQTAMIGTVPQHAQPLLGGWAVVGHALAAGLFVILLREWTIRRIWLADFEAVLDRRALVSSQVGGVCDECFEQLGTSAPVEVYREFYASKVDSSMRDINARWLFYYIWALAAMVPATLGFFVNFHDPDSVDQIRPWKELATPLTVASIEMVVNLLFATFLQTSWASSLTVVADQLGQFSHLDESLPMDQEIPDENMEIDPIALAETFQTQSMNPLQPGSMSQIMLAETIDPRTEFKRPRPNL